MPRHSAAAEELWCAARRGGSPSRRHAGGVLRHDDIGATTYGSIKSILEKGLDRAFAEPAAPDTPPIRHANIRGPGTYH